MGNCYKNTSNDKDTELNQNSRLSQKDQFLRAFVEEALNSHNIYRVKHGVPPLVENKNLSEFSQQWAENLVATSTFEHSNCQWQGNIVGENIAMCQGQVLSGELMTEMWYKEIKDYNYNNPGFTGGTGHFTQIVWKGSREFGVGVAQDRDGIYYAVANYYPAGNEVDAFSENVYPPKDD